jgi:hypothetical protein
MEARIVMDRRKERDRARRKRWKAKEADERRREMRNQEEAPLRRSDRSVAPQPPEQVLGCSLGLDLTRRTEPHVKGTNNASHAGHYDVPNLVKVASGFQRRTGRAKIGRDGRGAG